jgi:hypothetical protein
MTRDANGDASDAEHEYAPRVRTAPLRRFPHRRTLDP